MLKDSIPGFVENFAGRWLETRRLESVNPDRERFPILRLPAGFHAAGVGAVFQYIVSPDRPISISRREIYILNERLARHCGIPASPGGISQVDLTGTPAAACLLKQAF